MHWSGFDDTKAQIKSLAACIVKKKDDAFEEAKLADAFCYEGRRPRIMIAKWDKTDTIRQK
jgi:hypothetical protein